jgi:hypothetical protein
MLQSSLELAPETKAVFVTGQDDLRQRVQDLLPGAVFVQEPDTLVAALNRASRNAGA